MLIATAGHVDHGKTSLVRALTGTDTDRLPEEKARGMTIDLGFAYAENPNGDTLKFIDVPGHERFVRTMVAGVTGIDFALVVIAADDGPMPQTIEHISILDLLGIRRGAIVVAKADLLQNGSCEIKRAAAESVKATTLAESPIFLVSTVKNQGVEELKSYLFKAAVALVREPPKGYFRLPVDRSFVLPGVGLICTGTAFSGKVRVGERLIASPKGLELRVRSLHAQMKAVDVGFKGDRLGLQVAGSETRKDLIGRGVWLVNGAIHRPTQRLDAYMRTLAQEPKALKHWATVHVHVGTTETTGKVAILTGKSLPPGTAGYVQLVLDNEVAALRGDRFIIRDAAATRTIGGGFILDPFARAAGRNKAQRLDRLRAASEPCAVKALHGMLKAAPEGIDLSLFATSWNLDQKNANEVFEQVPMVRAGKGTAFDPLVWSQIRQHAADAVRAESERTSGRSGTKWSSLKAKIGSQIPQDAFEQLCRELAQKGEFVAQRGGLIGAPASNRLRGTDLALWRRVEPLLLDSKSVPTTRQAAFQLRMPEGIYIDFLKRLERHGLVAQIAENKYLHAEELNRVLRLAEAAALRNEDGKLTVGAFRDVAGIGRDLAIGILECFDRIGVTERHGDFRLVRKLLT